MPKDFWQKNVTKTAVAAVILSSDAIFRRKFCTSRKSVLHLHSDRTPCPVYMVDVAQSVRVTDCGSEGRGFEPHLPPEKVFERRPFLLADSRKSAQTILYINDMRNYFVFRPLIKRSEQLIGREMQKIGQVFAAAN